MLGWYGNSLFALGGDAMNQFVSIEEKMLIRATSKLEAEKAILARRQFDLSSSSAEDNLKNIMETLSKLPKDGGLTSLSLSSHILDSNSDASSLYTCDEIVNLAKGSQLISLNDGILRDICDRRMSKRIGVDDSNEDDDQQNKTSPLTGIGNLMNPEDLSDWCEWFQPPDNGDNEISIDERGRGIRRSRSKILLSESELWKQVFCVC